MLLLCCVVLPVSIQSPFCSYCVCSVVSSVHLSNMTLFRLACWLYSFLSAWIAKHEARRANADTQNSNNSWWHNLLWRTKWCQQCKSNPQYDSLCQEHVAHIKCNMPSNSVGNPLYNNCSLVDWFCWSVDLYVWIWVGWFGWSLIWGVLYIPLSYVRAHHVQLYECSSWGLSVSYCSPRVREQLGIRASWAVWRYARCPDGTRRKRSWKWRVSAEEGKDHTLRGGQGGWWCASDWFESRRLLWTHSQWRLRTREAER